jgi:hypothetical protein
MWCASCGSTQPRIDVAGVWEAKAPFSRFNYYYLNLMPDGNEIRGTACHFDDPVVMFRDVPVSGVYPSVEFTVTVMAIDGPLVQRFVGRVTQYGNVLGTLSSQYGAENLVFTRVDHALPKGCS